MKVEFSAFPKAFSGNVAVFVGADKQLHASAKAIDGTLGGAVMRAIAAGRFTGAKNQTLSVLGQAKFLAAVAARCRQGVRARCARRRGAGRAGRGRRQRGGAEGRHGRGRSNQGQQVHAGRGRGAYRPGRAAALLPLRQVQDQGQARAEELARAAHDRGRQPRRGAQGLCRARAGGRLGVLHPRPGERAGQRALSRRVRAPRQGAHQGRPQGRGAGRGRR